jgi:hypothetical protein
MGHEEEVGAKTPPPPRPATNGWMSSTIGPGRGPGSGVGRETFVIFANIWLIV